MGDHNSILRGIKPTDFSHVRKHAATFLHHARHKPGHAPPANVPTQSPALVSNLKKPPKAVLPIILISPSASSILRMSNIRSFLQDGLYVPPDASAATSNILHLQRSLPSINSTQRFILVDSPEQFKPDYWPRVVAVFTTGQAWQFKTYKWTQPMELFAHALGIYVGWRGDEIPAPVRGWGRSVVSIQLDKWNPTHSAQARWRDREVMESVWSAIEDSMRSKGWGKDGPR